MNVLLNYGEVCLVYGVVYVIFEFVVNMVVKFYCYYSSG